MRCHPRNFIAQPSYDAVVRFRLEERQWTARPIPQHIVLADEGTAQLVDARQVGKGPASASATCPKAPGSRARTASAVFGDLAPCRPPQCAACIALHIITPSSPPTKPLQGRPANQPPHARMVSLPCCLGSASPARAPNPSAIALHCFSFQMCRCIWHPPDAIDLSKLVFESRDRIGELYAAAVLPVDETRRTAQ